MGWTACRDTQHVRRGWGKGSILRWRSGDTRYRSVNDGEDEAKRPVWRLWRFWRFWSRGDSCWVRAFLIYVSSSHVFPGRTSEGGSYLLYIVLRKIAYVSSRISWGRRRSQCIGGEPSFILFARTLILIWLLDPNGRGDCAVTEEAGWRVQEDWYRWQPLSC